MQQQPQMRQVPPAPQVQQPQAQTTNIMRLANLYTYKPNERFKGS